MFGGGYLIGANSVPTKANDEFMIKDKVCHIGGMAKGSGMIHPNMATMLVFITSDVSISPAMLQKALSSDIADTFNMVSVDGDTSTNDMVTILANGEAGNEEIKEGITEKIKPDLIIVIDSLASQSISRIGTTIQMGNTGITPGAGVGNKRKVLNKSTLKIPVIAIGVPTVVTAEILLKEMLEKLKKMMLLMYLLF